MKKIDKNLPKFQSCQDIELNVQVRFVCRCEFQIIKIIMIIINALFRDGSVQFIFKSIERLFKINHCLDQNEGDIMSREAKNVYFKKDSEYLDEHKNCFRQDRLN